jgi:calcium-activated chloride channel regulator 4
MNAQSTMRMQRRFALALLVILLWSWFPGAALSAPDLLMAANVHDVTISLHNAPKTTQEREPYERIIRYFADAVFESSNGAHKIGKVTIYSRGAQANRADIVWVASCHPNGPVSGRGVRGWHINMCDSFSPNNFLADDTTGQKGGYTLAHEWGHFFYGLYDEYVGSASYDAIFHFPHSDDQAVPNSIMNNQFRAVGGQFGWLNFSTATTITRTAQYRVYQAAGWPTLVRPVSDDPRAGPRQSLTQRRAYSDMSAVAPGANQQPAIDLPGDARSDLKIVWVDQIAYQIVIDRSGSMDSDNKLTNAKTAAKLLVDLADPGITTTVGVIAFDDVVEVPQPLTRLDSQATRNNIKAAIDAITPRNTTAIGSAAQSALAGLQAGGLENASRMVYLLTDGINNAGIAPLSVIPSYVAAGVPLYTFGYGSDVDSGMLSSMARDTGGRHYFSPTGLAELTQVFQDANQAAAGAVGVAAHSSVLPTSTPTNYPLTVDSTLGKLNLVVTYNSAQANVTFAALQPDGTNAGAFSCSESAAETVCLLTIENPQAGVWTVQAETAQPNITLNYRATGVGDDRLTISAALTSLTGDQVTYPEPFVLVAVLGGEWPIAGATVTAEIRQPNGEIVPLTLRDDGAAPDALANDGLYSAIIGYTQEGIHDITVRFDNQAGAAYATEKSYAPSIGPDGKAVPLAAPIPIAENFQRFERIQVNALGFKTDDHGNTPDAATALALNNSNLAGKIDSAGDVDVFSLSGMGSDSVHVRVSDLALGMQPRLRLLAADKVTVLYDVDLTTNAAGNGYLLLPVSASSQPTIYAEVSDRQGGTGGVYHVSAGRAVSGEPSTGAGRVFLPVIARSLATSSCTADAPGESSNISDARIICSGQTVTGQVGPTDRDDVYKIYVLANQRVTIQLSGSGGDADLYLYPPGTNDVNTDGYVDKSAHDGNDETIAGQVLATAYWYVDVYSFSGTTNYTLIVTISEATSAATEAVPNGEYESFGKGETGGVKADVR